MATLRVRTPESQRVGAWYEASCEDDCKCNLCTYKERMQKIHEEWIGGMLLAFEYAEKCIVVSGEYLNSLDMQRVV